MTRYWQSGSNNSVVESCPAPEGIYQARDYHEANSIRRVQHLVKLIIINNDGMDDVGLWKFQLNYVWTRPYLLNLSASAHRARADNVTQIRERS